MVTIRLRLCKRLLKYLTKLVRVSYNIDKGNTEGQQQSHLDVDKNMVKVFHRGLKEIYYKPNHYCSYCSKPIPAGSRGYIHSGYGTEEDIAAPKVKLFLHTNCVDKIVSNEETLSRYVKNQRPPRDELEESLKVKMTLEGLLNDPKVIHHEGGCILWPTQAKDLRSRIKVGHGELERHTAAYLLAGKTLTAGSLIRHTCDVPNCINPDHLIEGTQKQNMADAIERGRRNTTGESLSIRQRAERTLQERSERLRRYGNPDWFEGWEDGRDEWLAQQ